MTEGELRFKTKAFVHRALEDIEGGWPNEEKIDQAVDKIVKDLRRLILCKCGDNCPFCVNNEEKNDV
jgi:hypothetical protein